MGKNQLFKRTLLTTMTMGLLVVTILLFSFAIYYPSTDYNNSIDNSLTTGIFAFSYIEENRGININNALPKSDSDGKAQLGNNENFDFTLNATTDGRHPINYVITAKQDASSDLSADLIKVYLTKVTHDKEIELEDDDLLFVELDNYKKNPQEKELYEGTVNLKTYTQKFRFRMWIKEGTDINAPSFLNKSFKIKINVYAN